MTMRSLGIAVVGLLFVASLFGVGHAQEATPPPETSLPAGEQQSGGPTAQPGLNPGFEVVPGHIEYAVMIHGESMAPALNAGDYVLIDGSEYRNSSPRRGDLVSFRLPRPDEADAVDTYVKRVVGLPGEHISFEDGMVLLNGIPLPEAYIDERTGCGPRPDHCDVVVPDGSVYVLGDRRTNSADSRLFGPVPMENVVGKAWFVHRDPTAHALPAPVYGVSG
jgi:signal peptidase I